MEKKPPKQNKTAEIKGFEKRNKSVQDGLGDQY